MPATVLFSVLWQRSTRLAFHTLVMLAVLQSGCMRTPLLEYSTQTPPLVRLPVEQSDVDDERARFREIYCTFARVYGRSMPFNRPCAEALMSLDDEPAPKGDFVDLSAPVTTRRVLIVPGLWAECFAGVLNPFQPAVKRLRARGYAVDYVPVGGRRSTPENARVIREYLAQLDLSPDERVVFVGYSKGTPDVLKALVDYEEVRERTDAVISIAGVVSGTPLADGATSLSKWALGAIPRAACEPGDGSEIESLSRDVRLRWLAETELPGSVAYFSVVALPEPGNVSTALTLSHAYLATVDPRNDGQVIFSDAVIPGSTLLAYVNADHWAVALRFPTTFTWSLTGADRNNFPQEILLETALRYVEESLVSSKPHDE